MPKNGFTGAHVDNVYMSRGTANVLTMWTPIGDIPPDMGTLAVCAESNTSERSAMTSSYDDPHRLALATS